MLLCDSEEKGKPFAVHHTFFSCFIYLSQWAISNKDYKATLKDPDLSSVWWAAVQRMFKYNTV